MYAQAVTGNVPEAETELPFAPGDTIKITNTDTGSADWWEGELNGRVGYFPSNFVKLIQQEEDKLPRKARVKFDYNSDIDEDLPVKVGDMITFVRLPESPEWVEAELNGKVGFVPIEFIEILPDVPPLVVEPAPVQAPTLPPREVTPIAPALPPREVATTPAQSQTVSKTTTTKSPKTPPLHCATTTTSSSTKPRPQPAPPKPAPTKVTALSAAQPANISRSKSPSNTDSTTTLGSTATTSSTNADLSKSSKQTPPEPPPPRNTTGKNTPNSKAAPPSSPKPPVHSTSPPLSSTTPPPSDERRWTVRSTEPLYCINNSHEWSDSLEPLSVSLTVGETKAKFSGLKKATFYIITLPNGKTVERRFKHFLWLHARLQEHFPILVLPGLPDKQISGRFDNNFIESRRKHLERYINLCAKHPAIRFSVIFQGFLTDTPQWKPWKRKMEKECREIGEKFPLQVDIANTTHEHMEQCGLELESFRKFSSKFERALMAINEADFAIQTKRAALASELDRFVERLEQLQVEPCWRKDCPQCSAFNEVLVTMNSIYHSESMAYKSAPENSTFFCDYTKDSAAVLLSFLETVKVRDAAEASYQKLEETHRKLKADNSSDASVERARAVYEVEKKLESTKESSEAHNGIFMAELNRMHHDRLSDGISALHSYALQQRDYHRIMEAKWAKTIESLEAINLNNSL
ncbi:sorting nexin associated protein 1 [Pelomyxa schiedti]|nr:sorting nexin associated protein 1 [Pelomyxa schiedti]